MVASTRALPAPMALASCNGTILVDDDGRLGVVERGGGWVGTALFVAVLLTVVPGGAGGFLVASGMVGGFVPLGVAVVFALVAVLLFRRWRRDKGSTAYPAPWLVFDVPSGVVRDQAGAVLGPLAQVRLERVMQVGSSSKALAAYCPKKIVIARGTPFGESVDQLEHALRSRGIGG